MICMRETLTSTNYIKEILLLIKNGDSDEGSKYGNNTYSQDKNVIVKIFNSTNSKSYADILARLTLIDSMYSTQMNRRYYALEEIATKLHEYSQKYDLAKWFIELAKNPEKITDLGIFASKYGIDKKCNKKGVAISLISKYAYFETKFNFPIYDSIACEMIPDIWKYCEWDEIPKYIIYEGNTLKVKGDDTIIAFIKTINKLIDKLGGNISYDHLDRLLWFVGKIRRGNLSLVLNKELYCKTYDIYKSKTGNKDIFYIGNISLNYLQYLKEDTVLFEFFNLAKTLEKKYPTKKEKKVKKQI